MDNDFEILNIPVSDPLQKYCLQFKMADKFNQRIINKHPGAKEKNTNVVKNSQVSC